MPEILSGSKQGNHAQMCLLVQFLKKNSLWNLILKRLKKQNFLESHETQLSREKICNPLHQPLKRLKWRNCSHPFTPICTHLHFRDFWKFASIQIHLQPFRGGWTLWLHRKNHYTQKRMQETKKPRNPEIVLQRNSTWENAREIINNLLSNNRGHLRQRLEPA